MIGNIERAIAKRKAQVAQRITERAAERRETLRRLATPLLRPRTAVMKAVDQMVMSVPKSPRLRNKAVLNLAKGRPCLLNSPVCNRDHLTTVACHGAGIALGKGMGYKLSDFWTVWGCSACNDYTDAYKRATAEQKAIVFYRGHGLQLIEWQSIADSPTEKPKDRAAAKWALDAYAQTQKGDVDVVL